mmetsp:Transcript_58262/g.157105  ORF Transcript_58262/g.157105 Transcript_58262/m.157105 type:complete len:364 (-) Transcript_58262:319-1410(-)
MPRGSGAGGGGMLCRPLSLAERRRCPGGGGGCEAAFLRGLSAQRRNSAASRLRCPGVDSRTMSASSLRSSASSSHERELATVGAQAKHGMSARPSQALTTTLLEELRPRFQSVTARLQNCRHGSPEPWRRRTASQSVPMNDMRCSTSCAGFNGLVGTCSRRLSGSIFASKAGIFESNLGSPWHACSNVSSTCSAVTLTMIRLRLPLCLRALSRQAAISSCETDSSSLAKWPCRAPSPGLQPDSEEKRLRRFWRSWPRPSESGPAWPVHVRCGCLSFVALRPPFGLHPSGASLDRKRPQRHLSLTPFFGLLTSLVGDADRSVPASVERVECLHVQDVAVPSAVRMGNNSPSAALRGLPGARMSL